MEPNDKSQTPNNNNGNPASPKKNTFEGMLKKKNFAKIIKAYISL